MDIRRNKALPPITRGIVQRVGGIRAVDAILRDGGAGVVRVPQLLECLQVLLSQVRGSVIVEVNRVIGRVGVRPAVVLQGGQPVVVVGGVDGSPALVVGGSRGRSQADTANPFVVPVVQQILCSAAAESGVQRNVVVLGLGGTGEAVSGRGLQLARAGAVDPVGVDVLEGVAVVVKLGHDLVGEAAANRGAATSLRPEDAGLGGVLRIISLNIMRARGRHNKSIYLP